MKILVIRLSSLGDVILSTAFLESLPPDSVVDWVVSKEFAFVLKGHPRIRHLIEYDKKTGLSGWLKLIYQWSHQDYDYRVDLHVTLRSQIARVFFHWMDLSHACWIPWKKISKQRIRFYGYLWFKNLWPKILRPTPIWKRFALKAMSFHSPSPGIRPPNLKYLLTTNPVGALERYALRSKTYFVVMPSSRWKSKEWSVDSYVELCRGLHQDKGWIPVVLGRKTDQSAVLLSDRLSQAPLPFRSILDENDFSVTGMIIQNSVFYVGSDTGLAHYAEAIGVPSHIVFGPTRPDLGFGPWRTESQSIYADLACAPCSKDGRFCYRFHQPYECLKRITVKMVQEKLP